MITQTQVQHHAEQCDMYNGTAMPLPVGPENVKEWYQLAYDVIHPETLDVIVPMGHYVTGYMLDALADSYGVDYVVTLP